MECVYFRAVENRHILVCGDVQPELYKSISAFVSEHDWHETNAAPGEPPAATSFVICRVSKASGFPADARYCVTPEAASKEVSSFLVQAGLDECTRAHPHVKAYFPTAWQRFHTERVDSSTCGPRSHGLTVAHEQELWKPYPYDMSGRDTMFHGFQQELHRRVVQLWSAVCTELDDDPHALVLDVFAWLLHCAMYGTTKDFLFLDEDHQQSQSTALLAKPPAFPALSERRVRHWIGLSLSTATSVKRGVQHTAHLLLADQLSVNKGALPYHPVDLSEATQNVLLQCAVCPVTRRTYLASPAGLLVHSHSLAVSTEWGPGIAFTARSVLYDKHQRHLGMRHLTTMLRNRFQRSSESDLSNRVLRPLTEGLTSSSTAVHLDRDTFLCCLAFLCMTCETSIALDACLRVRLSRKDEVRQIVTDLKKTEPDLSEPVGFGVTKQPDITGTDFISSLLLRCLIGPLSDGRQRLCTMFSEDQISIVYIPAAAPAASTAVAASATSSSSTSPAAKPAPAKPASGKLRSNRCFRLREETGSSLAAKAESFPFLTWEEGVDKGDSWLERTCLAGFSPLNSITLPLSTVDLRALSTQVPATPTPQSLLMRECFRCTPEFATCIAVVHHLSRQLAMRLPSDTPLPDPSMANSEFFRLYRVHTSSLANSSAGARGGELAALDGKTRLGTMDVWKLNPRLAAGFRESMFTCLGRSTATEPEVALATNLGGPRDEASARVVESGSGSGGLAVVLDTAIRRVDKEDMEELADFEEDDTSAPPPSTLASAMDDTAEASASQDPPKLSASSTVASDILRPEVFSRSRKNEVAPKPYENASDAERATESARSSRKRKDAGGESRHVSGGNAGHHGGTSSSSSSSSSSKLSRIEETQKKHSQTTRERSRTREGDDGTRRRGDSGPAVPRAITKVAPAAPGKITVRLLRPGGKGHARDESSGSSSAKSSVRGATSKPEGTATAKPVGRPAALGSEVKSATNSNPTTRPGGNTDSAAKSTTRPVTEASKPTGKPTDKPASKPATVLTTGPAAKPNKQADKPVTKSETTKPVAAKPVATPGASGKSTQKQGAMPGTSSRDTRPGDRKPDAGSNPRGSGGHTGDAADSRRRRSPIRGRSRSRSSGRMRPPRASRSPHYPPLPRRSSRGSSLHRSMSPRRHPMSSHIPPCGYCIERGYTLKAGGHGTVWCSWGPHKTACATCADSGLHVRGHATGSCPRPRSPRHDSRSPYRDSRSSHRDSRSPRRDPQSPRRGSRSPREPRRQPPRDGISHGQRRPRGGRGRGKARKNDPAPDVAKNGGGDNSSAAPDSSKDGDRNDGDVLPRVRNPGSDSPQRSPARSRSRDPRRSPRRRSTSPSSDEDGEVSAKANIVLSDPESRAEEHSPSAVDSPGASVDLADLVA